MVLPSDTWSILLLVDSTFLLSLDLKKQISNKSRISNTINPIAMLNPIISPLLSDSVSQKKKFSFWSFFLIFTEILLSFFGGTVGFVGISQLMEFNVQLCNKSSSSLSVWIKELGYSYVSVVYLS